MVSSREMEIKEIFMEENKYKVGDIFYCDEDYSNKVKFASENNYCIKEIEADENGERRFQICEIPELTENQILEQQIFELKSLLAKYKEDVEQVELFDMERDDYEEKKKACSTLILQLREKETKLKKLENTKGEQSNG